MEVVDEAVAFWFNDAGGFVGDIGGAINGLEDGACGWCE